MENGGDDHQGPILQGQQDGDWEHLKDEATFRRHAGHQMRITLGQHCSTILMQCGPFGRSYRPQKDRLRSLWRTGGFR